MDNEIIATLCNIYNYNKFSSLIREDRLQDDYRDIYKSLSNYYDQSPDDEINWDRFKQWYTIIEHPSLPEGKAAAISSACDRLKETEVDTESAIFRTLSERYFASLIHEKSFEVVQGKKSLDEVKDILRRFNLESKGVEHDVDSITSTDEQVLEQVKELQTEVRYKWSIEELNLMCGAIGQGDFILLGARPDGGKTTFLLNQACAFASQLDDGECILWCNNEEPRRRVAARRFQAGLGWTREEIDADPETALKHFQAKYGENRIVSLDKPTLTVYDIEAALEEFNPKVIIIDQLHKVGGFEKEAQGIERYAKLAQYIRGLSQLYGPVIGASQLDWTADNVKFPEMGSLYGSKTAVQGESDCILLLGQCREEGTDVRFLSTPKNKLPYADENYRSIGQPVKIDKARAQFISLIGGKYANKI